MREYDFLSPPSAEAIYALEESLKASEEQFDVFAAAPKVPPKIDLPVIEPPAAPPQRRIDLGNVGIPPGLDEYTAASQQGSDYLVELGQALENQGYPERALLVYERLLDSTAAPPAVHRDAADALIRLRPVVSRWVVDPAETRIIQIHAGATSVKSDALEEALRLVSTDLEEASSGLLKAEAKLTVSESEIVDRVLPVAVWINVKDLPDASTSVLTFTPSDENPELMINRVAEILYQLIRRTLDSTGSFRPLPELSDVEDPRDVLKARITRLQWRAFSEELERNGRPEQEDSEEIPQ